MSTARFTRVACYAIVLNAERQILLCRMSQGLPDAGRWTLPGGGVDFGEDLQTAAVREVFEETGLHVELAGVADAHSQHILRPDKEFHAVRVTFWADVVGGELQDEVGGSTDKCSFHSAEDLKECQVVPLVNRAIAIARDLGRWD